MKTITLAALVTLSVAAHKLASPIAELPNGVQLISRVAP